MANHLSAQKRIRTNGRKRDNNTVQKTSLKKALKKFRATQDKKSAGDQLPKIVALLDKLAKRNIIHRNKAANVKSKLTRHVAKMA